MTKGRGVEQAVINVIKTEAAISLRKLLMNTGMLIKKLTIKSHSNFSDLS
jgi:hypothetical protein